MAAVTQQLLLRELAPGTPGSAGTADPEQAPGAAQGWARLGKAGAVLGSEVPVPPSPSLLTSGPAHLVWGEHTPVRDCWELKSMCLAYFSTQILLLFLFFLSLPPTIIPRPFGQSCALHSEVMPDTFWSLDKILDARVVPMESALAPGMGYAPGRGESRGDEEQCCSSHLPFPPPSWEGALPRAQPLTARTGDMAATILG